MERIDTEMIVDKEDVPKREYSVCPDEKEKAIEDGVRHFDII